MKELAISHPEPTSSFKFITITKPEDAKDKDRRRIVRKYVMKNIGRARRKPPSNPTIELFVDSECQLGSGEIDPFVNFPFELTASDRELVANSMYSQASLASCIWPDRYFQPLSSGSIPNVPSNSTRLTT